MVTRFNRTVRIALVQQVTVRTRQTAVKVKSHSLNIFDLTTKSSCFCFRCWWMSAGWPLWSPCQLHKYTRILLVRLSPWLPDGSEGMSRSADVNHTQMFDTIRRCWSLCIVCVVCRYRWVCVSSSNRPPGVWTQGRVHKHTRIFHLFLSGGIRAGAGRTQLRRSVWCLCACV